MNFDENRSLVMVTARTVLGHRLKPGTRLLVVDRPQNPGEVNIDMARLLFNSDRAVYLEDYRPTPVETREEEARREVQIEATGGGWFTITAPWLAEPIKIQGEAAAQREYERLVAEGRPGAQPTAVAALNPVSATAVNPDAPLTPLVLTDDDEED